MPVKPPSDQLLEQFAELYRAGNDPLRAKNEVIDLSEPDVSEIYPEDMDK